MSGGKVRELTDGQIADQRDGSTRLAPGVWADRDGHLHFSLPELLAFFDIEDTEENRARLTEYVDAMVKEQGGDVVVQKRRADVVVQKRRADG